MGAADVGRRDISFETTSLLAAPDMYDVSLTSAAWRLVELTSERRALVVSTNGVVQWIVSSLAWHYPLVERRQRLPSGSIAAFVAAGETPKHRREMVHPAVWLSTADGRVRHTSGVELFESTHAIRRLGRTLSLLWAISE